MNLFTCTSYFPYISYTQINVTWKYIPFVNNHLQWDFQSALSSTWSHTLREMFFVQGTRNPMDPDQRWRSSPCRVVFVACGHFQGHNGRKKGWVKVPMGRSGFLGDQKVFEVTAKGLRSFLQTHGRKTSITVKAPPIPCRGRGHTTFH